MLNLTLKKSLNGLFLPFFATVTLSLATLASETCAPLLEANSTGEGQKSSLLLQDDTLLRTDNETLYKRMEGALLHRNWMVSQIKAVGPEFISQRSIEDIVEDLVVFAEGWEVANYESLDISVIRQLAEKFGVTEKNLVKLNSDKIVKNINRAKTKWLKRHLFFSKTNLFEVLANELIEREIPWNLRATTFKKYLFDHRTQRNELISTYALDPLLGLASQAFYLDELRRNNFEMTYEGSIDGQRTGLGYPTRNLWSNYYKIYLFFRNLKFSPGERIVDIGSGIGRVGLFVAAMFPQLQFVGLEYLKERRDFASSVANRFSLNQIQFVQSDINKDNLPVADYYYFYNSLSKEPYNKMLSELQNLAHKGHKYTFLSILDHEGQLELQQFLKLKEIIYWKFIKSRWRRNQLDPMDEYQVLSIEMEMKGQIFESKKDKNKLGIFDIFSHFNFIN